MSIKRALLYTFTIGAMCVFLTWLIGHLWVFIILILSTLIGIAVSIANDGKKAGSNSADDE